MKVSSLKCRSFVTGIFILTALTAAIALSPVSAQETRPAGITVTAQGEVSATPDIAYVSLGVVTRDTTARQAASENARIAQAIINAVKQQGIAEKDIQTQNYSVTPWMEYPREGTPRQLGYEVRNTVRVTVRDIRKIGDVIDAGVQAGANEVQGVSFGIDNEETLANQALQQAVKTAQGKAQTIASALGVKLGRPISVTTAGPTIPRPFFRGAVAAAPAMETPISPGEIEITQDVTVTYAIL